MIHDLTGLMWATWTDASQVSLPFASIICYLPLSNHCVPRKTICADELCLSTRKVYLKTAITFSDQFVLSEFENWHLPWSRLLVFTSSWQPSSAFRSQMFATETPRSWIKTLWKRPVRFFFRYWMNSNQSGKSHHETIYDKRKSWKISTE